MGKVAQQASGQLERRVADRSRGFGLDGESSCKVFKQPVIKSSHRDYFIQGCSTEDNPMAIVSQYIIFLQRLFDKPRGSD